MSPSIYKFAFLAFEGFEKDLEFELTHHEQSSINKTNSNELVKFGRLYLSNHKPPNLIWAQDIWTDIDVIDVDSIQDAYKKLKTYGNRWCFYSHNYHRRSQLIAENFKKIKVSKLNFLEQIEYKPDMGFCLIEQNKLLIAKKRTHIIPLGEVHFSENKTEPPSRAYLKLWELMTVHKIIPKKSDTCIDFGSCPGGWSWVLSGVSKKVISIDKAPLDKKVSMIKNIEFIKADAFKLDPKKFKGVDWFFSDIICYPPKLLDLVNVWMQESQIPNFVCTIKFQGKTDFETVENFLKIPGSRVIHLYNNKHEVTWVRTS